MARLAGDADDPALRDRLVLAHAPMVKWIAYRKVRELPAWCDMEDFISAGVEAILRSLDRYDPAKGATLKQSRGRGSTAPSWTSCASTTGRRARSGAACAPPATRRTTSPRSTAATPPARSSPTPPG